MPDWITTQPDPKIKVHRSKKYRTWLTTQPCCGCGTPPRDSLQIVPAHIGGGMGIKGSDRNALPLCVKCHAEEHRGQATFWKRRDRERLVIEHRMRYVNPS